MTLRTAALRLSLTAGILCAALLAVRAEGAENKQEAAKKNPATTPVPREKGWMKRHEGFVEIAKKGGVDVLFLGDSITDAWRNKPAKPTWDKYFKPLGAANFGIGGDRTEHVLWRIQQGELEGISPKAIVLMIGTNNSGNNSAEQIAAGIKAIVQTLRAKTPTSKILLLGVFPRGPQPGTEVRKKIAAINNMISKLGEKDKHIRYMDIGSKFLDSDGTLTKDIMPDYLHLSARGYEIWGEAIAPAVNEMVGKTGAGS
jgi:lysophospholipase L1-like esterase